MSQQAFNWEGPDGHAYRALVVDEGGAVRVEYWSAVEGPGWTRQGTILLEKSAYNELWLQSDALALRWIADATGLPVGNELVKWVDYTLFAMGQPKS
jgi:hypothetical protein